MGTFANLSKTLQKLDSHISGNKKAHDELVKDAKGNKDMEALAKQLQKLGDQQKKVLNNMIKLEKNSK